MKSIKLSQQIPTRFIGIVLLINFLLLPAQLFSNEKDTKSTSNSVTELNTVAGTNLNISQEKPLNPLDFFPILPWSPLHGWGRGLQESYITHRQGLSSIAECNFTIAGFVKPEDLPLCEKLGLVAILIGDSGFTSGKEWSLLTGEEIDKRIKAMVEKSGSSKAVMGYFITDEPGASHFPALAKAVQAVKKYAPGKLAYINLFPDYATLGAKNLSQLETATYAEHLERFAREVSPQIISYDNYMVQYSQDLKDSKKAASYYLNLLEIRRVALKYDIPFWNIVSSNQIRPETSIPSPANLLFQAYTTLAAGGKGVSWYTYYAGGYKYAPIDSFENKTLTWRYLQEVNRQMKVLGPVMNQLKSTGVYFTSPPPVAGLPLIPGTLIKDAEYNTSLMIGEFTGDNGTRYVMVVNLSLEKSAKFILKTQESLQKLQIVSAENGTLISMDNNTGLWLVAGQGMLIKL